MLVQVTNDKSLFHTFVASLVVEISAGGNRYGSESDDLLKSGRDRNVLVPYWFTPLSTWL